MEVYARCSQDNKEFHVDQKIEWTYKYSLTYVIQLITLRSKNEHCCESMNENIYLITARSFHPCLLIEWLNGYLKPATCSEKK